MKLILIPFLLLPLPALAGADSIAQCLFDRECIEGESCDETDYTLMVYKNSDAVFIMESASETITGEFFDDQGGEGTSTLFGNSSGAAHLLTIAANGDARYSVQMDGPMVISYLGNCERAN